MGTPAAVRVGPGLIYIAPVGTNAPTAGTGIPESAGWVPIGYTEEGHTFSAEISYEDIEVAEELDPIDTRPVRRTSMISFQMAEYTVRNLSVAFNGGTIGTPSGGTVTFSPPDLGEEEPLAILWRSDLHDEALYLKRCLQTGTVESARQKSPNKALIAVEFRITIPADASRPWVYYGNDDFPFTDPH
jgi:hypothetical protein